MKATIGKIMDETKQRTLKQNKSLHLLMTHIADELNESGLSMMRVLSRQAEIPWTPTSAKDYLFRPFIHAMYSKDSTTKLTTKEIGDAMNAMCDHLAKVTGKVFEIPSIDSLIDNQRLNGK